MATEQQVRLLTTLYKSLAFILNSLPTSVIPLSLLSSHWSPFKFLEHTKFLFSLRTFAHAKHSAWNVVSPSAFPFQALSEMLPPYWGLPLSPSPNWPFSSTPLSLHLLFSPWLAYHCEILGFLLVTCLFYLNICPSEGRDKVWLVHCHIFSL